VEEAEDVEVEVAAAVEAFPATTTTPKEATITTTTKVPLVLPLLLLVQAMPHEVKDEKAKKEHDVSLVDDSIEEVEEEVVKEVMVKAIKVETNPVELQTTTTITTITTTTEVMVPLVLEAVVPLAPEEDVLPDVNFPIEHLQTPHCSLRISPSDSMTKDFPSCSKTKRSQRPTLLKTEMEDLKDSVLSNSTMRLTKKQLWMRAQSCQRREES